MEKKDRLFSNLTIKNTYLYNYITSNKFNELIENIKNKPAVCQYYILNKILYQTKDDSYIPGSICTVGNDIFIINNITSEGIIKELTKHDLTKVGSKNLGFILFKDYTIKLKMKILIRS